MSIDYNVACDRCKLTRHLGQAMGGTYSFGFGTNDVEESRLAMEFISIHSSCGPSIRVVLSDQDWDPANSYHHLDAGVPNRDPYWDNDRIVERNKLEAAAEHKRRILK